MGSRRLREPAMPDTAVKVDPGADVWHVQRADGRTVCGQPVYGDPPATMRRSKVPADAKRCRRCPWPPRLHVVPGGR